jgi:xeroderma pigmentosum group C-complementing protein
MPPKRKGRPSKTPNSLANDLDNSSDVNSPDIKSKSTTAMAGKKTASRDKGKGKAWSSGSAVPDVYREMLAETLPMQPEFPERPLKRRRTGQRNVLPTTDDSAKSAEVDNEDNEDEMEFEDILKARNQDDSEASEFEAPLNTQQTAYRDSDEDSGDSDDEWEGVDFDTLPLENEPSGDLELTLKPRTTPQGQKVTPRRKVVSKADKVLRLEAHKMHVLCLLTHLDRRNEWCNDDDVKSSLKPLLDKKMLTFLRPRSDLSQFGRAESLKRGLEQVSTMWRTKFNITTRGIRRALWAEDEKDIQNVSKSIVTHEFHRC